MVSARELAEDSIPGSGWVNEKLVYTHGFGAVLSPANDVNAVGQPEFLLRDIPPITSAEELVIDQPRIYFSDTADAGYLIVDTNQDEVDYPVGESEVERNRYDGSGGVDLGGSFRRAAWALRFGDVDVLISGQLRADSKVLLARNISDRVAKVAPFLHADADPYLVISGGRLVWVMDLYTVSDDYPYSSFADTSRLNQSAGLPGNFNYIRNSVKATVDAFTGEMTLYVIDEADPLIQAQRSIFPDLFTTEPLPEELREHLRYPEDLFRVQSDMYLLYHVTDARDFFSGVDPWEIASDPSNTVREELRGEGGFVDPTSGEAVRPMLPYYLLMRLPNEEDMSFLIMQPFTPQSRPNMVSFMVAKSGPADYGQMVDFRLPAQSAQQGPGQVGQFINQDPEISAQFTLLSQGGSDVIQGNMLVVPDRGVVAVRPADIHQGQQRWWRRDPRVQAGGGVLQRADRDGRDAHRDAGDHLRHLGGADRAHRPDGTDRAHRADRARWGAVGRGRRPARRRRRGLPRSGRLPHRRRPGGVRRRRRRGPGPARAGARPHRAGRDLAGLHGCPVPTDHSARWYNHRHTAGWSSLVARRAHNPKVAGSNPAPATNESPC